MITGVFNGNVMLLSLISTTFLQPYHFLSQGFLIPDSYVQYLGGNRLLIYFYTSGRIGYKSCNVFYMTSLANRHHKIRRAFRTPTFCFLDVPDNSRIYISLIVNILSINLWFDFGLYRVHMFLQS